MKDKISLRKRSIIETINDQLKNIAHAEHSRHRSFGDCITNLVASLIAYSFQEKKPALSLKQKMQHNWRFFVKPLYQTQVVSKDGLFDPIIPFTKLSLFLLSASKVVNFNVIKSTFPLFDAGTTGLVSLGNAIL